MSPSDVRDMLMTVARYESSVSLTVRDLRAEFRERLFPFPPIVSDDEALMGYGRSASGFFRWSSVPPELMGHDKLIVTTRGRTYLLTGVHAVGRSSLSGRADIEPTWRMAMLLWPQELVDVVGAFSV